MKNILICHSHPDASWRERLISALRTALPDKAVTAWSDEEAEASAKPVNDLHAALSDVDILIPLISAHFLTADVIREVLIPEMLERRDKGNLLIVPLLVGPCAWRTVGWLNKLRLFPESKHPLALEREHRIQTTLETFMGFIAARANTTFSTQDVWSTSHRPKVSISRLPVTDAVLYGRDAELAALDQAWADENCAVVTLIAWGGIGKTALVNHWLSRMQTNGYRGARRVYGWSFYSQGAAEGGQISADAFMHETLSWFGDPDPSDGSPHDKGKRLARLVCESRTLLILDGLEPLQYPQISYPVMDHGTAGGVKDPGLKVFLKELAGNMNGLCVVTSRESLTDLRIHWGYGVRVIDLAHLSVTAGTELLKGAGVWGPEADLRTAVAEFGGHALSLGLLGAYLKRAHRGDIRRRDRIARLTDEPERGRHAQRVLAAHADWLGKSVELDILSVLGLFDRPAPAGALAVLRAKPVIPGLTKRLVKLDEEDWNIALSRLRETGLLAKPKIEGTGDLGTLDCHPLVREFFGERLREKHPKAWQEAHKRLYYYYEGLPKKGKPDTLAEMEPLFAAVAHACKAGMFQEALYEVYHKRIRRGNENYLTQKLGAFGTDISILSNFFQKPWRRPIPELPEDNRSLVLSWAAFGLRALGRLREAMEPMRASLELMEHLENWRDAALIASNLSELLLTLGDVSEAVAVARRGTGHADRCGDWGMQLILRTTLAHALHQWGRLGEAVQWFREAEAAQREHQREYPYLYSLQGYNYCDLLLYDGNGPRIQEVRERAEKGMENATMHGWLLDIAMSHLNLGRTWLLEAVPWDDPPTVDARHPLNWARHHLDRAVAGLREANYQEYLAQGILTRARCLRLQGEREVAAMELKEVFEIATMGEMKLILTDYYLEKFDLDKNKEDLQKAKTLMEETEYCRRKPDIEDRLR